MFIDCRALFVYIVRFFSSYIVCSQIDMFAGQSRAKKTSVVFYDTSQGSFEMSFQPPCFLNMFVGPFSWIVGFFSCKQCVLTHQNARSVLF